MGGVFNMHKQYFKFISGIFFVLIAVSLATPVLAGNSNLFTKHSSHKSEKKSSKKADKLEIDLREWNVTLNKESVKAGKVSIAAKNRGGEVHELVLIKMNEGMMMATGRLPVSQHGDIEEGKMRFGRLIGEIEGLTPGKKVKQEFDLAPGRYAIVCNMLEQEPDGSLEAHYSMGMHALLTVE